MRELDPRVGRSLLRRGSLYSTKLQEVGDTQATYDTSAVVELALPKKADAQWVGPPACGLTLPEEAGGQWAGLSAREPAQPGVAGAARVGQQAGCAVALAGASAAASLTSWPSTDGGWLEAGPSSRKAPHQQGCAALAWGIKPLASCCFRNVSTAFS